MSNESIALAKHLDLDKMVFPALLSVKLDGVPIKLVVTNDKGTVRYDAVTRQHEYALSVSDDMRVFVECNTDTFHEHEDTTWVFVFETTHVTYTEFKDISGVVRRQSPQSGLKYNLFDYDRFSITATSSGDAFEFRISQAGDFYYPLKFETIHQMHYFDQATLQDALDNTPIAADQEGWIIRSAAAPWKPGTRHWDYQKVVKEPTIDLWIVGVKEGKGKFAGGAGKLIAEYKGAEIGVGPGKQSAAERGELWEEWKQWQFAINNGYKATKWRRMACIKYKPDDGYVALRQATFQHWRDDKGEPDA